MLYMVSKFKLKITSNSGREYGTASLEIHLKSCKQKWELEESKKPLKERRPVPEQPKSFDDVNLISLLFLRWLLGLSLVEAPKIFSNIIMKRSSSTMTWLLYLVITVEGLSCLIDLLSISRAVTRLILIRIMKKRRKRCLPVVQGIITALQTWETNQSKVKKALVVTCAEDLLARVSWSSI